jgi:hypothetical protein
MTLRLVLEKKGPSPSQQLFNLSLRLRVSEDIPQKDLFFVRLASCAIAEMDAGQSKRGHVFCKNAWSNGRKH